MTAEVALVSSPASGTTYLGVSNGSFRQLPPTANPPSLIQWTFYGPQNNYYIICSKYSPGGGMTYYWHCDVANNRVILNTTTNVSSIMADHRNQFRLDGNNPFQIHPRVRLAKYVKYPSSSDDSLPLVDEASNWTAFELQLVDSLKFYKQLQTPGIWCSLLSICVVYTVWLIIITHLQE